MPTRRFEMREGTSDKFWEVKVDGATLTVTFGRAGTAGQTKDKAFASAADAAREAAKLIAEKTKKGYVEVGAVAAKAGDAPSKNPAAPSKAAPSEAPAKAAQAAKVVGAPAKARKTPKPIADLLETIAAKEKKLAKQLRAPASDDALETLRALGAPDLLVALYACHDGTEAELHGAYQLLPVDRVVAERAMMNDLLAKDPAWQEAGTWSTKWIPFFADGDGQYFCIDPEGSCNGGPPGQVIFYDHEAGAERELTSFDVFVGLLTTLAKKKLLGAQAREDREDEVEALIAEARTVGLPKMPPKQLKAVLARMDGGGDTRDPEAQLALLMPLVRAFGAEDRLWSAVRDAAAKLERWPLVIEAGQTAMRLASKDTKSWGVPALVLALHRTGRDADALGVLKKGIEWQGGANQSRVALIPAGMSPALRADGLRLITELHPTDQEAWMLLGTESTDRAVRTTAFKKVIALVDAMFVGGYFFDERKVQAQRHLEHDRIAGLSPEARLDALTAFAKRIQKGNNAGLWLDVASAAAALGRWEEAAVAGAKLVEHTYEGNRYQVCSHQVRALHELGRDDEALQVLRAAIEASHFASMTSCFVAIPWHEARESGDLSRKGARRAFEARGFAVVTELAPDNFDAWQWRWKLSTGSELVAVLQHVIAHCTEAATKTSGGEPYHDADELAALAALKAQAQRDLDAARAAPNKR